MKNILGTLLILTACAADPGTSTVRVSTDPIVIPPGGQDFICQTFPNPAGREVDVLAWSALQAEAGHHVQVFVVDDGTPVPAGKCDGLPFGGLAFQSQGRGATTTLRYPDGIARRLPANSGLHVEVHYLNTSDAAVTMSKTVELEIAEPDDDRQRVGPLFMENLDIEVPPHTTRAVSRTCKIERDIELVWLSAHLHYHGLSFEAAAGGAPLYRTDDPIEPPLQTFEAPRRVAAGTELSFSCNYRNDSGQPIGFGQDLEKDEMCILSGAYVLPGGGDAPLLRCSSGRCLTCAESLAGADPSLACTDDGPPSSADKLAALQACTCDPGRCGGACGASACAGGAPDDACRACLDTTCGAEAMACFAN